MCQGCRILHNLVTFYHPMSQKNNGAKDKEQKANETVLVYIYIKKQTDMGGCLCMLLSSKGSVGNSQTVSKASINYRKNWMA